MRLPGLIGLSRRARGAIAQPILHAVNRRVRRGSSRRDADDISFTKPFFAQIRRRLDVMHPGAKLRTGVDQFLRVVAMGTTDDDNRVALFCKFSGSVLPLLCRLTNRVNEAHFGFWEMLADQLHQPPNLFNRLRRLRDDTEPLSAPEVSASHSLPAPRQIRPNPPSCRELRHGRVFR